MLRWREILGLGCLALAAILPFSPALLADFVAWDDDINVTQNPLVQGLDGARLRWMFGSAEQAMRYKPLNWLAWALIYQAQGLRPFGFHLANLVFHSANTVLLFLILRRMLQLAGTAGPTSGSSRAVNVAAVSAALLWAWHPLRVEPVAWVTGLPYGLALLFMLVSWLAYLEAGCGGKGARRWYWGAVGAFALAALTYPTVILFVGVLVALDYGLFRRFATAGGVWRDPVARRIWVEKIPFVLLAGAMLAPTLIERLAPGERSRYEDFAGLREFGVFPRVMQAFYVWAYYVWKPLVPTDLAVVYPTFVDFNPASVPFVLSLSFVVVISLTLVVCRKRWPAALALWLAYLVVTVPVLGLTERPHYPSDRYAHLPNLAWAVAVAFGLRWSWAKAGLRAGTLAVCGSVVLLCGLLAFWQTTVWNNTISLFEATLESLEGTNYRGDIAWRLGRAYDRSGNAKRAGECFELFRKTGWGEARGHAYAAGFWLDHGDVPAAAYHIHEAVRGSPKDAVVLSVLGTMAFREGNFARARELYLASLAEEPRQSVTIEKLAETLDRLGQAGEAAMVRERAKRAGAEAVPPNRSGPR